MPGIPERIGTAINELDIDFSRFTIAGWTVGIASLGLGFLTALVAYWSVVGKIQDDRGPALVFGIVMIATTVALFLSLRGILARFQVQIVRDRNVENRDSPLP